MRKNLKKIIPPVGFRKTIPPFRIFITWDITYRCNYTCSYCSLGQGEDLARKPKTEVLSREVWSGIWTDIYEEYGSCQVHLTGGEPFAYPGIMDIVEDLVRMHTFECSTNLFWDVEDFIKRIPPERARIGTSYHPEMVSFDEFLDKTKKLKEAGFEVWSNYVAYPPFLKDIKTAKKKFLDIGINMSILPFNGMYNNKEYPDAYTKKEKDCLKELGADLPWVKKTIDWAFDKKIKKSKPKTKDKKKFCIMGVMYAKIHADGNIYRCCAEEPLLLGNIIDGGLKLLDKPVECDIGNCPCWKSMVLGDEDRWETHWPVPPEARET